MTPEETHGATKVADAIHDHRPASSELVRGGRPGSRVLLILVVSAGAAAVLLLGMWFLSNGGFASQNPAPAETAATAQNFNDTDVQSTGVPSTGGPSAPPVPPAPSR